MIAGCSNQAGNEASYQSQMDMIQKSNDLMNQLDWNGYAAMLDPVSLDNFRNTLMPGIQTLAIATQADTVNLFGKVFKVEELQNAEPDSFFVIIMNLATELAPELKATFETMKNENVGAVADGDSLVLVVARTDMVISGRPVNELNVSSCRLVGGEWKVVLSPKVEGIAMMMRSGLPQ